MVYTHTHIGRKRQSIFMGTFKITFKIGDEKRGGVRLVHVTCNIVRVNSMSYFFFFVASGLFSFLCIRYFQWECWHLTVSSLLAA